MADEIPAPPEVVAAATEKIPQADASPETPLSEPIIHNADDPTPPDADIPPVKTPETTRSSPEREVAQRLIDSRTNQLSEDEDTDKYNKMNDGDKALYSAFAFRGGLPEGGGSSLDKGKTIEGVRMTVGDQEYTVVSISKARTEDDKRVYSAMVKDPANPDGDPIALPDPLSGDALADAYIAKHADEIAKNFPEEGQRDLVAWHVKGGETDLSLAATEFVAKEINPFQEADESIANQIVLIEASLTAEGLPGEERQIKNMLLTELKLAEVLPGDIGKLAKLNALKRSQNQAGPAVSQNIQEVLTALEPQRQEAQTALDQMLEGTGQPKNKIETWKKLASDPDGLNKLLSDPDFINLPDMSQLVFGKGLTTEEAANIDQRIEDFAKTHTTETQRNLLAKYSKKGGMGALWILAILLAIPAVAAAGAVSVAAGVTKQGR